MTFGALLRQLRIAAGLSQEALAERARISAKAVGSLEVGARRAPYRETVEQLSIALNATPEERSQLTALAQSARTRKPRTVVSPQSVAPHRLPSPPTRLIGREKEGAASRDPPPEPPSPNAGRPWRRWQDRVAIALATEHRLRFPDGAWFVDLAALSGASAVTPTVAAVLGISTARTPAPEAIAEFLHERRALLVLDNCEHVLDTVAQLSRAVLKRGGESHILATSREPLRTDGEAVFEIPALECPPPDARLTADAAMRYSAVELFASAH